MYVYLYIYMVQKEVIPNLTVFLKGRAFSPLADAHLPHRSYRFLNPNAPRSFPPSLK